MSRQSSLQPARATTAFERPATTLPNPMGSLVGRRSFLQAGAMLPLAALLTDLPTSQGSAPRARGVTAIQQPADYQLAQAQPFYLQASCELSEDYFLTDDVLLDASDTIIPFTGLSGAVEALVLANGSPMHLQRDSSSVSGWTYAVIPGAPEGTIIDAAIITDGTGVPYLLCYVHMPIVGYTLSFFELTASNGWTLVTKSTQTNSPGALRSALAPDGSAYFYSTAPSGAITLWHSTGPSFTRLSITSLVGTSTKDAIVLWDPAGTKGSALLLSTANTISVFPQSGPTTFDPNASSTFDATALLWAGTAPASAETPDPLFVYQQSDGTVQYILEGVGQGSLAVPGDTLGDGQLAVWEQADLYSFAYLDDGLVTVVTQYGDPTSSATFTDPIPLQPGVARLYGQPSDPSQSTLFLVGDDLTLSVLTKNPTTGWSLTQVQQAGETIQEVDGWRVQISVLDANGIPAYGAQLQLAADGPLGFWSTAGNTLLGSEPVILTSDYQGQVTFTIPVIELDVPQLTATLLDDSGKPTGVPLTITPDFDVRNFFAGQGQLTDIGSLSGPTLLAAKNSDGSPLLPSLTSLPSSEQATSATAVAGAVNHVASLGLGSTPQTPSDPRSAKFDLSGSAPTFQTSTDPNAFDSVTAIQGIGDWWDTTKHDAESVFHAVRHAATTAKTLVTSWQQDVSQWTINLIMDIGNGVDAAITWVVSSVADAVHAISSFFHALGADLAKAWGWLKHHVLALLRAVGANATVMEGWIDQAGPAFATMVTDLQDFTDGFFASLETKATDAINGIATHFEDRTFGQAAPIPAPTNDTGSSDLDVVVKGVGEIGKVFHHVSDNWLFEKLKSHLPFRDGNGGPSTDPDSVALVDDLEKLIAAQLQTMIDLALLVGSTYEHAFGSAAEFSAAEFSDIVGGFDQLIHDVLNLADILIDTILQLVKVTLDALSNVFDYEVSSVPFIGQLLKLVDIDPTISIKHMVALLTAFPATLVHGCVTSGPLFPTTSAAPERVSKVEGAHDPWAVGLGFASMAIQFIWSFVDQHEDQKLLDDSRGAPTWWTYVDNTAPVLLGVLQWPGAQINGLTAPPFSPRDTGGPDGELITAYQLLGVAPSIFALFGWLAGITTVGTEGEDTGAGYEGYFVPIANCISGIGCVILTSLWNVATDQNTNSEAIAVMGELSYVAAPLGIKEVLVAYGGVPWVVKIIVDCIGNYGTAAAFADQAASGI